MRQSGERAAVVALVLSLLVHLLAFTVIPLRSARRERPPAQVEFVVAPRASPEEPRPPGPPLAVARTHEKRALPPERPVPRPRTVVAPRPPEKLERPPVELHVERPAPPPPGKQFVKQRVREKQEAPENARFLAAENRRVAEETVARLRRLDGDDREQSPGPSQTLPSPETGNAAEDGRSGSDRERQGHLERTRGRPTASENLAMAEPTPGAPGPRGAAGMPEPIVGEGTMEVPAAAAPGSPEGGGRRGPLQLRLSWGQFADIYGEEELAAQRDVAEKMRQSRFRGSSHERRWGRIRAAIENHVYNVRAGNQTALNAAASPFADYLNSMHNRIHPYFAEGFVAGLADLPRSSPLRDRDLFCILEIAVDPDGGVGDIAIVQNSGVLPFDVAAIDSVLQAAPFAVSPPAIRSGDGRVYMHWGFYANQRQCGTFNAEPYILPHPPAMDRERRDRGALLPRPG